MESLILAGIHDVRPVVDAYGLSGGKVEDVREVGARGLLGQWDPDAQALASTVVADLQLYPLAPGEQLNLIGYSGGATTAFNAALLLERMGIGIDNIVTIGGVVFRGKPGNVSVWTSIIGTLDPVPHFGVYHFSDQSVVIQGADHLGYVGGIYVGDTINAILASGVR